MTKTSKCSGPDLHRARFTPTVDPRRYVSCSPLSHCRFRCRILIPPDTSVYPKLGGKKNLRLGRSSGAVLNQLLASRPANFSSCPRSYRCPPSHPISPYALPFAPNLHTANFHAQFRNNIMLPKRLTQTGVSEQHYTDLESRYPKNMP
jgi:hypothetical protein